MPMEATAEAPLDELLLLLLEPQGTEFDVAAGPAAAAAADDECFVPDDWGLVLLLFGEDEDDGDVSVVRLIAWSAPALSGAFG